jgi:nucleotide-binding universal stress UspA family protein
MYKTIVVHVNGAQGKSATLRAASNITNSMGSHLIGTATSGLAEVNYLLAAGAPMAMVPALDIDTLRQDAEQHLRVFEEHCREFGVTSYETRMLDTSAIDALLMQSRYCDLLVVGQEQMNTDGLLMPAPLPGALVTQAARPVLLVPPSAPVDDRFDKIMIAWNGSLGASHVIAFAMPLIKRAAKIYIAVCNAEADRIDTGGDPGADLATYLARHHHNVELVRRDTDEDADAALTILASELKVNLMLAGAFGHSRLHDWVLGSTTRGLIARATIPLLMTH